MFIRFALCLICQVAILFFTARHTKADVPHQATGLKVGEVTDTTAIVWTRLTLRARPNPPDAPMYTVHYEHYDKHPDYPANHPNRSRWIVKKATTAYPDGTSHDEIRYEVPGTQGEVRVAYRIAGSDQWQHTKWTTVDPNGDFVHQFKLSGLRPNSDYQVDVHCRNQDGKGTPLSGKFRTAPAKDQAEKVVFTVSTGQMFNDRDNENGFDLYRGMLKWNPSFFVHTGDIVYYDDLAKNVAQARYHWHRTYSLPSNVDFHRHVGSYFMKDDHDTWTNDCWSTLPSKFQGEFTFEQGLKLFPEQVPMGEKTYRTVRWGKDLQVWLVEGRDFRSPNTDPDGPDKTIWGAEQKKWFKSTVAASDATFRVLISPTPIVGPDRVENKHDNHSNIDFKHEGDEIRAFIAKQKNMIVVCGDRHWQYHSTHPESGVREYSCGPASNKHAGGWSNKDFRKDYHQFLKVRGGFLSVTCDRDGTTPTLRVRFHAVDGDVRYEDRIVAKGA